MEMFVHSDTAQATLSSSSIIPSTTFLSVARKTEADRLFATNAMESRLHGNTVAFPDQRDKETLHIYNVRILTGNGSVRSMERWCLNQLQWSQRGPFSGPKGNARENNVPIHRAGSRPIG